MLKDQTENQSETQKAEVVQEVYLDTFVSSFSPGIAPVVSLSRRHKNKKMSLSLKKDAKLSSPIAVENDFRYKNKAKELAMKFFRWGCRNNRSKG